MKMTNGIRISMQYFAEQTKITDLIDPEVMSDMIDAKIESKITVSPFAKIDRTLVGVPGDTITVLSISISATQLMLQRALKPKLSSLKQTPLRLR